VFKELNAAISPKPVKNAATIASPNPPTSYSKHHPYTNCEEGMIRKKAKRPL
jgi:hypothetical protein